MSCYKAVDYLSCRYCQGATVKFGKQGISQRYRCKICRKIQLVTYKKRAYAADLNPSIAAHIKEGCGIRSIARLLHISAATVLSRIQKIADSIERPAIATKRVYEIDELKTYIKKKSNDYWLIYALDRESKRVVDFIVGKRNKKNLKMVIDTLLLAECKRIHTDGLEVYRFIIPEDTHRVNRYGTNRIERKNLTLRTHLKRLGRKTIAFSKTLLMLTACLKIYFWF